MAQLTADVLGMLTATAAMLGLNELFSRLFSHEDLDGLPRWRWLLSVALESVAFPTCIGLAIGLNGGLSRRWLLQPWGAFSRPLFPRIYLYALFGAQTRDGFRMSNRLILVHHLVVMATSAGALFLPAAPGLYSLGTAVLEFGSIFYNLRTLYPSSALVKYAYGLVMPISNALAVWLAWILYASPLAVTGPVKAVYIASVLGVCYGRQRHQLIDFGIWGRPSAKKPPPLLP